MQRYLKWIAGLSVVAAATVVASQTQRSAHVQGETETAQSQEPIAPDTAPPDAPILVSDRAPLPPATPEPPSAAPQMQAEISELTARLVEREADLAALEATLAARDASLDEITATLTAREAELQALRDEIATLRERYAFDIELAAMKSGGTPTLDAADDPADAEAGAAEAETLLASAKGPAAPPPASSVLALTEIHFDSGSSSLSPGGQVHCAAAAVMLADMAVSRIRLLGFADRVGSPARNRTLAEARARAVADYLVAAGVPGALIEAAGMGESDLPVATADGIPEPLNRAVSIIAVPRPTG